jgi:hypothetical protein
MAQKVQTYTLALGHRLTAIARRLLPSRIGTDLVAGQAGAFFDECQHVRIVAFVIVQVAEQHMVLAIVLDKALFH